MSLTKEKYDKVKRFYWGYVIGYTERGEEIINMLDVKFRPEQPRGPECPSAYIVYKNLTHLQLLKYNEYLKGRTQ